MVRLPDFNPYDYLVRRKFLGVPVTYVNSELLPRELAKQPHKRDEIERWREQANRYRDQLHAMPKEAFDALLKAEQGKESEEARTKAADEENRRFFNQPHAVANFDHWSRAAHWSLDEAIALSLGKDPAVVSWHRLEPLKQVSGFALRYGQLLDLARRAVPWEKLFDPVLPGIFIAWARQNEIPFPEELERKIRDRGNYIGNWKTFYDQIKQSHDELTTRYNSSNEQWKSLLQDAVDQRNVALEKLSALQRESELAANKSLERGLTTRERDSLLKLVIGIAIGGYGYDPLPKKSDKVSEITSDLELAGVPLDADTVRKWLRAAAELLPPKETD